MPVNAAGDTAQRVPNKTAAPFKLLPTACVAILMNYANFPLNRFRYNVYRIANIINVFILHTASSGADFRIAPTVPASGSFCVCVHKRQL